MVKLKTELSWLSWAYSSLVIVVHPVRYKISKYLCLLVALYAHLDLDPEVLGMLDCEISSSCM